MVLIDMSGRFSERMLPDVVTQLWDLRDAGRTREEIAVLLGWKKNTSDCLKNLTGALSRDDNLASQFRDWLHEQKGTQNIN